MKLSTPAKIALAFLIVYVVWGSTYLAIRIGLESMPPLLMAGVRFLVAGILLWGWCEWRGEARGNRRETINAAIGGMFLVALGNGLVTWAEQSVASGVAALIVAVGPAFTVLLLWMGQTREKPTGKTLLGVALGIAGVGILVMDKDGAQVDPLGAGLIVLATLAWSHGVLFSQRVEMPSSALRTNAVQMLAGAFAMILFGLATGESNRVHLEKVTPASLLALAYLIVFGSILAYSAYGWLIRHVSATAAGTTAFVNPAIAVLLGAFWGEKIDGKALLAMGAIFGGVWLLKQKSAKEARPTREMCPPTKVCESTGS